MENNGTEILRQPMFKTPLMIGPFDPDREGGYNEMNQVSLFGAVWQSKRDNNQTAPAVWDGGNIITPNTTDWFMVSGDYEAWLLNKDKPATTGTTGDYPYNGMGRVTLKKHMVNGHNLLYQDDFYKGEVGSRVPNTNTVFEVPYEFELAEDITIPAGCVLKFEGGSISNGTITMSYGVIVDGVFNNCSIYSPVPVDSNVKLLINNCKFNISDDRTAIHVLGKPEKKVVLTNLQIIGDQTHTITGIKLGDATENRGCVNVTICNSYIFGLTNGVLLSKETDVISIHNNHFYRNTNSINCENKNIRTDIDIFDNHFQGSYNGSVYIYMNGAFVNIHNNIFEVPDRTDITFINIDGGSNVTISQNAFENTDSTNADNVIGIILQGSCQSVYLERLLFSGAFGKPIWIKGTAYHPIYLLKGIEYHPIGSSPQPAHLITNELILSQYGYVGMSSVYDADNYTGTYYMGKLVKSGSIYFYKTEAASINLKGPYGWVSLDLFEINNSKRHTIELDLSTDAAGSIPNTLTIWSYSASTNEITFSCSNQTINTTISYAINVLFQAMR